MENRRTPGAPAGATAEASRFEKVAYPSATTGNDRQCWVWQPASHQPRSGLPVLYALHGIGGTEDEWVDNAKPQAILDQLYAAGQIPAMIVVFPNGRAMANDRVPQDLFGPAAIAAFAAFSDDLKGSLIPFIQQRYRAAGERTKRAICGLSMGGGQALNIGLGHPELFDYVGAFSSAPNTDPAQFRLDDAQNRPRVIWLTCGTSDKLIKFSELADRFLSGKSIPHSYRPMPGDHDWGVWVDGFTTFVQLIFR